MISETPQNPHDPLCLLTATERLRVGQLLDEYELAQDQGRAVTAEELCRTETHLLPAVEASLQRLAAVDRTLLRGVPLEPPDLIGEFQVLEQIGIGGSGFVFRCRQQNPDREVAVKILKPSLDADVQRRRFRREMLVCEALNEPGLAEVYVTGVTEWNGVRCFWIAMELIDGGNIRQYVERHNCSTRQILKMFRQVCGTVQAAHRQGIIHRDLKPSNLLVTCQGEPRVVDFGVAALLQEGQSRETTEIEYLIVGTTAWMAPEVLRGEVSQADTRSDIFSLGVILFKLLSGEHPYDAHSLNMAQVTHRLANAPVKRLASVTDGISRDLDTFVARLIETDVAWRYQNLDDVIADTDRLIAGNPIQARRLSPFEKLWRWTERHRLLSVALLTAIVAVAFSIRSHFAFTAQLQDAAARLEQTNMELSRHSAALQRALKRQERAHANARMMNLQDLVVSNPRQAAKELRDPTVFPVTRRSAGWRLLDYQSRTEYYESPSHDGAMRSLRFGSDDHLVASLGDQGRLRCRDLRRDHRLFEALGYQARSEIRFSPDDDFVYAVGSDGGILKRRVANGQLVDTLLSGVPLSRRFDVSASGDNLVALTDAARLIRLNMTDGTQKTVSLSADDVVIALWFQKDGQSIGVVTESGMLKTWATISLEPETEQDLRMIDGQMKDLRWAAQWSNPACGQGIAVGHRFSVCLAATHMEQHNPTLSRLLIHDQRIRGVHFLPPCFVLAAGNITTRIRDLSGRTPDRLFYAPESNASASAVSPGGRRLAIGDEAGTTRLYGLERPSPVRQVLRPFRDWDNPNYGVPVSTNCLPKAKRIVIGYSSGWLGSVDALTGDAVDTFHIAPAAVRTLAVSPNERWLVCGLGTIEHGGVSVYRFSTDGRLSNAVPPFDSKPPQPIAHLKMPKVHRVLFSEDGDRVLVALRRGEILRINTTSWQVEQRWQSAGADLYAMDICGDQLATAGTDGHIRLWNWQTAELQLEWKAHTRRITDLVFDPSGERLYSASHDGTVATWTTSGQPLRRITDHSSAVMCVAISPDGETLASGGKDFSIRFRDARTGDAQIVLDDGTGMVQSLRFTEFGLLSTSHDSTTRLWGDGVIDSEPGPR